MMCILSGISTDVFFSILFLVFIPTIPVAYQLIDRKDCTQLLVEISPEYSVAYKI